MKIELQKPYLLKDLIEFSYHENVGNQAWKSKLYYLFFFCNYHCLHLYSTTTVFLDEIDPDKYPEHDEGYSPFIERHSLDLCCSGEIFISVMMSYKDKNASLDYALFLQHLDYYKKHDDFM